MSKKYQTLHALLLDFPHIRLAKAEDNLAILNFYHNSEMQNKTDSIRYTRGPDFFKFLKERSPHYLIFTMWNDDQKLVGIGVVSYREGYINGEKVTIGYLGDLRVALNRKLIREWRRMYTAFITFSPYLPDTFYCRHYQTVLMESNAKAKSNLTSNRIEALHYQLFAPYEMINIVGRIKIPFLSKKEFQIMRADESHREQLIHFLNRNDQQRQFGRNWKEECDFRIKNWNHFQWDNFIIITNKKQEWLAVTSIWNPIESKQVETNRIPFHFNFFIPLLNILPFIQLKPLPKVNSPIEILYLNQIHFAEEDQILRSTGLKQKIFQEIVDHLFHLPFHLLAYCDFKNDSLLKNNYNLITQKMPMGFYTVHYKSEDGIIRHPIENQKNNLDPGFDMALV